MSAPIKIEMPIGFETEGGRKLNALANMTAMGIANACDANTIICLSKEVRVGEHDMAIAVVGKDGQSRIARSLVEYLMLWCQKYIEADDAAQKKPD